METRVRIAAATDLELIVPMMEAFNRFESIEWSRATGESALRRLLADASLGLVGLAETSGGVAGYFVLTWGFDLEWNGRDAFLTELWLEPAYRYRKLGSEVLAQVEALAIEHGVRALHLLVRHENEAAQRLYARAGFVTPPRAFLTKRLGN